MIFLIWIFAIALQIGIVGFFSFQFFGYKPPCSIQKELVISIIIAAHNEEKNLKKLIPALLNQNYPKFEIVIGLDRTTDGSLDYLKSLKHPEIRWVEIVNPPKHYNEKKYALSQAIDLSKGDWLIFTDADCLPASSNWIREMSSHMSIKDILLGYSPYQSNGSFRQSFIQYEAFITAFNYLALAITGKPYMGVGRNMAIRTSFFKKVGGYTTIQAIKGGDDDLFIQHHASSTNTGVVLGKESLVYTYPEKTWKGYWDQKVRHLSVGRHYSFRDQLFHVLFNSSLMACWLLLPWLSGKIMLPIILFYLFIKLLGYRFAQIRMGFGFNHILLPFVEFMYSLLIPVIAIRSKLVKDIKWKN